MSSTDVTRRVGAALLSSAAAALVGRAAYRAVVRGDVTVSLGVGRRVRPLGPLRIEIAAPREVVFDVIAQPYLGRQTRAMAEKIDVLERGTDMVLAAHRTPVSDGLVATTVETVRFTAPERVDFRLLRGPVPHVVEEFVLTPRDGGTLLTYDGELGTDLGPLGRVWGDAVAAKWEAAVQATFDAVKAEAERRTR